MKQPTRKSSQTARAISRDKLIRAVASSTAIETGEAVNTIEARLKSAPNRVKRLKLA